MRHAPYLVRFGLVGVSGVAVNYAILYLLAGILGLNHLLAAAFATEGAILSNFALNNLWTFRGARKVVPWARKALRYNLFALGGLVISLGVLAALTYLLGLHYLIANLFAIGAATLWNYAANYRWTWSIVPFVHHRNPDPETD
jgi:dolichol-phosphate mannosyltransferase